MTGLYGAGTDANVQIRIIGSKGSSSVHNLMSSENMFERGSTDKFVLTDNAEIGQLTAIELKRDEAGWFAGWQLARVIAKNTKTRKWSLFEFNQWTKPNEWFTIKVTCDPGFQKNATTGLCDGPTCGPRPTARLTSGTVALPGAWPWQAMLRFTTYDRAMFCGGSLIFPRWVLTTAYCVYGKRVQDIFVRLGAYRRDTTTDSDQDINGEKVFIHPDYHRPNLFSNDLALLKLTQPATLSDKVGLVCLPNKEIDLPVGDPSEPCWITGWGYLDLSSGALPDKLMQAQIPLAPKAQCQADYPTKNMDESMICAGSNITGVGACQGDTGGPFTRDIRGKWYLEGAFSWGNSCNPEKKYKHQIYSNISHLREWIDNTIADNQWA